MQRILRALALILLATACSDGGAADRPSVVLIVVDTLRADHLGLYGHGRETSPELDRWGEEAAVFENAFAPSCWTLPSFGSMLTGHIPSRHAAGTVLQQRPGRLPKVALLGEDVATLAEILQQAGYRTGAVVNNPYLHPGFGLNRGFEDYDYAATDNVQLRRADDVRERCLEWIDGAAGEPYFLMVHLMDPHMNYDPPPATRGSFTSGLDTDRTLPVEDGQEIRSRSAELEPAETAFIAGAYDEELLFVDREMGRLLDALLGGEEGDRPVVLLTSDHGEELFDHGGFEHGHSMYNELLHVPLMVWGPDVAARRIDAAVSLVDVFPTVLEACGAKLPGEVDGVSLWPALTESEAVERGPIVVERTLYGTEQKALIDWPYKLVVGIEPEDDRLYDLASDAGEENDIVAREPAVRDRLREELRSRVKRAMAAQRDARPAEVDDSTAAELRALGYTQDE